MADSERKRLILNQFQPDGAKLEEAAQRVLASPDLRLLRENSPTSLLIEGAADAVARLLGDLKGWNVLPVVTYARPDTRARVLEPPS